LQGVPDLHSTRRRKEALLSGTIQVTGHLRSPLEPQQWLRQDPMPKTWLRNDTVALEEIAAGDSPLCSAWGQTGPDALRRVLIDAVFRRELAV